MKPFGSRDSYQESGVEGHSSLGVGGGSTFISSSGVDGSSFFILTPSSVFSWTISSSWSLFHHVTLCLPSDVLLLLCAIHNSLLNHTILSVTFLILSNLCLSALHCFTSFLAASSSGSISCMSYWIVLHCAIWRHWLPSNWFGSVKEVEPSVDLQEIFTNWSHYFRHGSLLGSSVECGGGVEKINYRIHCSK